MKSVPRVLTLLLTIILIVLLPRPILALDNIWLENGVLRKSACVDMVARLRSRSQIPNKENKYWQAVLYAICNQSDPWDYAQETSQIIGLLVEKGVPLSVAKPNFGHLAMLVANGGNIVALRRLLSLGVPLEYQAFLGRSRPHNVTFLMAAARGGHNNMVEFLLAHGAKVDAKDSWGRSVFIYAAEAGNLSVLKRLFACAGSKFAINTEDSGGQTPLMYAAENGNSAAVQFFIKHGAQVFDKDDWGENLVSFAAQGGDLQTVDFFLKKGVSPKETTCAGYSSLMAAARSGNKAVVIKMLELGLQVTQRENDGTTVLMHGIAGGNTSVVELLLARGGDVRRANYNAEATSLMWAVGLNNLAIVKLLLAHGADIEKTVASNGETVLTFALETNNPEVFSFVLAHSRNINRKNKAGQTILMLACTMRASPNKKLWFVRSIVEKGADISIRDRKNRTAIDYAKNPAIREFLIKQRRPTP